MQSEERKLFIRLVCALERIASTVIQDHKHRKRGILQMKDVDRASVYSKHLGRKLRNAKKTR